MSDELVSKIFQMISASGAAKAKYIEAIRSAKVYDFDKALVLIKEGGDYFAEAHNVHGEMLALEANALMDTGDKSSVSLVLVHAEDQMMCAETFRLISEEFIDVYKKLEEK